MELDIIKGKDGCEAFGVMHIAETEAKAFCKDCPDFALCAQVSHLNVACMTHNLLVDVFSAAGLIAKQGIIKPR